MGHSGVRELIYWGQCLQNAHPSVQLTNSASERSVFTGSPGYADGFGGSIDGNAGCSDFDGAAKPINAPETSASSVLTMLSVPPRRLESPADYEKSLTAHLAQLIIQRRLFLRPSPQMALDPYTVDSFVSFTSVQPLA